MGGPAGAWLASALLRAIGIVSLLIAPVLFLVGLAMALGFIRWPKTKRFVGFAAVLVVCSGLAHIEHPDLGMTRLPRGLGGVIGTFLGDTLMRTIGYGGAVIGLSLAGIASLVISGNLTVSGTARFLEYLVFVLGRIASQPTRRDNRRAAGPPAGEAVAATNGQHEKRPARSVAANNGDEDRKSTRLNSSHVAISYAVFCLKKKRSRRTSSRPSSAPPHGARGHA